MLNIEAESLWGNIAYSDKDRDYLDREESKEHHAVKEKYDVQRKRLIKHTEETLSLVLTHVKEAFILKNAGRSVTAKWTSSFTIERGIDCKVESKKTLRLNATRKAEMTSFRGGSPYLTEYFDCPLDEPDRFFISIGVPSRDHMGRRGETLIVFNVNIHGKVLGAYTPFTGLTMSVDKDSYLQDGLEIYLGDKYQEDTEMCVSYITKILGSVNKKGYHDK